MRRHSPRGRCRSGYASVRSGESRSSVGTSQSRRLHEVGSIILLPHSGHSIVGTAPPSNVDMPSSIQALRRSPRVDCRRSSRPVRRSSASSSSGFTGQSRLQRRQHHASRIELPRIVVSRTTEPCSVQRTQWDGRGSLVNASRLYSDRGFRHTREMGAFRVRDFPDA